MDRGYREVYIIMALIISDQYPNQTNPVSPEFPQGSAKDVSAQGAGDGTPWKAALVNEDLAFKQAILLESGEKPDGSPDTAKRSQYLIGLKKIISKLIAEQTQTYFVRFGWNGARIEIYASKGVAKVTRQWTGQYEIHFSKAFPDTKYAVVGNAQQGTNTGSNFANVLVPITYNKGSVVVFTGDNSTDQFYDSRNVSVTIVR